jgi:hypothetical protein
MWNQPARSIASSICEGRAGTVTMPADM